jgi:hypothetical protein
MTSRLKLPTDIVRDALGPGHRPPDRAPRPASTQRPGYLFFASNATSWFTGIGLQKR